MFSVLVSTYKARVPGSISILQLEPSHRIDLPYLDIWMVYTHLSDTGESPESIDCLVYECESRYIKDWTAAGYK